MSTFTLVVDRKPLDDEAAQPGVQADTESTSALIERATKALPSLADEGRVVDPSSSRRPIRVVPTLLVDTDDGLREIVRHEGYGIDFVAVAQAEASGAHAAAARDAVDIAPKPSPADAALAAIKATPAALVTPAQIAAWIQARF